jgi:hypothetical protein
MTIAASAGELATAAGIGRAVAYNELRALSEAGEIVKSELPGGVTGYAPAPAAPEPGWSGCKPEAHAVPLDLDGPLVLAPRRWTPGAQKHRLEGQQRSSGVRARHQTSVRAGRRQRRAGPGRSGPAHEDAVAPLAYCPAPWRGRGFRCESTC